MNPLDPRGAAIHADLHQVSMAAACWDHGITQPATFEISFRALPPGWGYLLASGLDPCLQYLLDWQLDKDSIVFLRNLFWMHPVRKEFWDYLGELRFHGDVWAAPEGTPIFPGEPFLRVTAPITQALLVETYLLQTLSYSSAVATRTARLCDAARGKPVVDFGLRRSSSPAAALLAARAAYSAGAGGSSNAAAALETGVPIYSSHASGFVLAFPDEAEAFRAWHGTYHETATVALDTHDAVAAARTLAGLGLKVRAVLLDAGSGDLAALATTVRGILDEAGLRSVRIHAGGAIDEATLLRAAEQSAPIDLYQLGGELSDPGVALRPPLAFDLVEMAGRDGGWTPRLARSPARAALPGTKQVYRSFGIDGRARRDLLALAAEKQLGAPLLQEWMKDGAVPVSRPGLESLRAYTQKALSTLPPALRRLDAGETFPVERSAALEQLRLELASETSG